MENVYCHLKLSAHHRYSLGIGWKPQARCKHPHHPVTTGKKASSNRTVSLEILQFVCSRYGFTLPVGSSFCYNHLRSESASFRAPSISPVKSLVQQRTPTDSDYHPEEIILSSDVTENAQASGSSLSDILDASPIQYQIKQKKVEELSENTKRLLKGKFIRFEQQLEKKVAEVIAPGHSDEFIQTVLNDQL